jgi:hypothetical protein
VAGSRAQGIYSRRGAFRVYFLISCLLANHNIAAPVVSHRINTFMSEFLQELTHNTEFQATVLVLMAALLGLLYLLYVRVRRWRCERDIKRIVHRLGARVIKDIRLADGTGGEVTIEYLLLARDAFIIVSVMRFDGLIFGGRLTNQWTQVLGRNSYKFDNPNHYLQRQVDAISLIIPGIPVSGRQLFTNATFPRDKPDSVLLPGDLGNLPKRPRYRDITKKFRAAWKQVKKAGV